MKKLWKALLAVVLLAGSSILINTHVFYAQNTEPFATVSQNEIEILGEDRNFEVRVSTSSTWEFTPDVTGYYRLRTLQPAASFNSVDAAMNVFQADDDTDSRRGKMIAEGEYATSVYMIEGVTYDLVFTTYTMAQFPTYIAKVALEEAVVLPDDVWMSKRNYHEVYTIDQGLNMTIQKIGQHDHVDYDVSTLYNPTATGGATTYYNDNDLFYRWAATLTIDEGFTDIEIGYFYNLIGITFPKTTQSVRGLQNITSLIRADLPASARLEDIHTSLFAGTLVKLVKVEEFLFWNNNAVVYEPISGATETFFPVGTDYVAAEILQNQTNLIQVHLCEGIRNIGKRAMAGCTSLKKILVPTALTTIQEEAFRGDTALSEVAFMADTTSGLKSIGDRAFYDCPSLKELYVPQTVEHIGDYALGYVTSSAGTPVVGTDPTTGFSTLVIKCEQNSAAHDYAVKNNIRYEIIGWDYQPGLVPTVDLLGAIEEYKGGYYRVTSVTAPLTVSYIRPANTACKTAVIPSQISCYGGTFTVNCIESYAFRGCKKLKSVSIPNTVTLIKNNVFDGCKRLKKIHVLGTAVKSVGRNSFRGIHEKAVIVLPKSAGKQYAKRFVKKGQGPKVKIKLK